MKGNKELFELIKSLNKNEKRYFRLFALLQKGDKKYITLFNEIGKQKDYNEVNFRNSLNDKKLREHFAFNKNYLRKLILKSLILYNSNNITDIKIQSIISNAKILFKKGLFRQYFKTISHAKKLALKHERYGYLLEILDMEKIIIKKEELQTIKMQDLYKQVFSSLDKLHNIFEYSKMISFLLTNYRHTGIRREEKHDRNLFQIINCDLLHDDSRAISFRAKETFYRTKQLIGESQGNYNNVLENLKKRMRIVNKYPHIFEDNIIDLRIDVLVDLINTCIKLNKLKEYEKYLNILNSLKPTSESDRIDVEIIITFFRFNLLIKKKYYTEAYEYIPHVEQLLLKYENKLLLETELTLRFYIVKTLILVKKYDEALDSINTLLSHRLINKREDYRFYLRILNLIIHYELKNYSLLNHLIRSTYRALSKHNRLYKTEELILKFLRKLPGIKDEKYHLAHLENFRNNLAILKKQSYEKNAFEYFDFLEWANTKI